MLRQKMYHNVWMRGHSISDNKKLSYCRESAHLTSLYHMVQKTIRYVEPWGKDHECDSEIGHGEVSRVATACTGQSRWAEILQIVLSMAALQYRRGGQNWQPGNLNGLKTSQYQAHGVMHSVSTRCVWQDLDEMEVWIWDTDCVWLCIASSTQGGMVHFMVKVKGQAHKVNLFNTSRTYSLPSSVQRFLTTSNKCTDSHGTFLT